MWNRCSLLLVGLLACRPETTPIKETPYKAAAERFAMAYCARAFAEGCSVPEDCGLPGGFEEQDDCEFQLVPFMRSCAVPEEDAEPVVDQLQECERTLAEATCDESLCDGGPLDTDPCLGLFETLAEYCVFEGL